MKSVKWTKSKNHSSRHAQIDAEQQTSAPKAEKRNPSVHPLVNFWMRLTGEWPLSGPPELTEEQYKHLFDSAPAFADYFPVVDYLNEDEVYLLDDGMNVAKIWRVNTRYMYAGSNESLERFNIAITQALDALPAGEEYPYIAQFFCPERG